MTSTTIDIGIDLGTTNSVVAVANAGGIEVIKNQGRELTPSLVYVDKKGRRYVGHAARQSLTSEKKASSVQKEFKRLMGQSVQLPFGDTGIGMNPEELSAEVLSSLRDAVAERFGAAPKSAVITVPASFEIPQNEATVRAAKLAGFEHAVLLQEPVAAASAYGFQSDSDKAYWIVYDLGGGTFDVSIVSVRDGQLTVVANKGDNYLGGADFDRAILEEVLLPPLHESYQFDHLSVAVDDSDLVNRSRIAILRTAAEELKINLSRMESEELFREEIMNDDNLNSVDLECSLTRPTFCRLIDVHIDRTIEITRELIADSGLQSSNFEKLLLVGGSTFIPRIRERVAELGIPMDFSLDPMTVVAYGAAVFASGQRVPRELTTVEAVAAGCATIELEYEPLTKDPKPLIGGKILIDGKPAPAGTEIEIRRMDGDLEGWTSGNISIDAKGLFFAHVMIHDKGQSQFVIRVRSVSGDRLECSPDRFAITSGMSVSKTTLTQSLGVMLADGSCHILAPSGVSLPHTTETYPATYVRSLKAGSDDNLVVPITFGDEEIAEHNLIGSLFKLKGKQVDRDVPESSEVEIVAEITTDQTFVLSFTIPVLGQTFTVNCEDKASEIEIESSEVMRERLARVQASLDELEEKAEQAGDQDMLRQVRAFRDSRTFVELEKHLDAHEQGDRESAGRARTLLLEASKKAHGLSSRIDWPAAVHEYRELLGETRKVVHEYGESDDKQMLETISSEGDRAIDAEDTNMLQRARDQLMTLSISMKAKDIVFWATYLAYLEQQEEEFPDRDAACELIAEGARALRRDDIDSLRTVVLQLREMLPAAVSVDAPAAFSSIM